MNAPDHVAEAERLLTELEDDGAYMAPVDQNQMVQLATIHVLIAIADGLGVPHQTAGAGGPSSG